MNNLKRCSIASVLAIVTGTGYYATTGEQMKTSPQGLEHIANKEGCIAEPYKCTANTLTVGLGSTTKIDPNKTYSDQEIAEMFSRDVQLAEQCVNSRVKVPLKQHQYDMMVSFVFNLGCGSFSRSTMLVELNNKNYVGACRWFPRWSYVNGKKSKGVYNRRVEEMGICLYGYK